MQNSMLGTAWVEVQPHKKRQSCGLCRINGTSKYNKNSLPRGGGGYKLHSGAGIREGRE